MMSFPSGTGKANMTDEEISELPRIDMDSLEKQNVVYIIEGGKGLNISQDWTMGEYHRSGSFNGNIFIRETDGKRRYYETFEECLMTEGLVMEKGAWILIVHPKYRENFAAFSVYTDREMAALFLRYGIS